MENHDPSVPWLLFGAEFLGTALLVVVGLSFVILAFWLMGKLGARHTLGYLFAQLTGAVIGALPLIAWGQMGRSGAFGATLPGTGYGVG